jgi:dihydroflavonol-4-reductase
MKILVTGATGFLGSTLVPMLAAEGHSVRALSRNGAGPHGIKGDVLSRESMRAALEGCEAVYHLAGLVSRDPADARKMYELHVDGTRNLLALAKEAGVKRVVLASSSGTIGVSKERRIATESDHYPIETVGRWPYYLSKIYEEKIAIEANRNGLPVVILNPSLLLGPGDSRLSSTQDIFRFLMGRIPVMPKGGISFVDVRDAARAFVTALSQGNPGERHLLGAVNWEFHEFFARLGRIAHKPPPPYRLPSTLKVLGAHLMEELAKRQHREPDLPASDVEMGECWFFIDSSKSERLLDFKPRDPVETLNDTVAYVREHFVAGD